MVGGEACVWDPCVVMTMMPRRKQETGLAPQNESSLIPSLFVQLLSSQSFNAVIILFSIVYLSIHLSIHPSPSLSLPLSPSLPKTCFWWLYDRIV